VTRAEIFQVVQETIVSILPRMADACLPCDLHLRDIGADSIDRVEIIVLLIQRFGLDEPMSSFDDLPDIDALVDLLCKRQSVHRSRSHARRN
jgi:polyketide biosynthesis acyl carrier protein